jgi:hypothetical protein
MPNMLKITSVPHSSVLTYSGKTAFYSVFGGMKPPQDISIQKATPGSESAIVVQ